MTSALRPTTRLALEPLEAREVPTASLVNGVLTVRGTDMADEITIDRVDTPDAVYVRVTENGQATDFRASDVRRVRVFANGGDDYIAHNFAALNAVLYGGDGDDTIYGDDGRDYLNGGAGFDTLHGWGGNDTLVGGDGNDKLYGEDGYDHLYGGGGRDWLNAGSAAEPADGGPGRDFNAYVWVYNGARATDINQLASQTCCFLASLAGVAHTGLIDMGGQISYVGDDTYNVRLFVNGAWQDVSVFFNGEPTRDDNGIYDVRSDREGEFWPLLYQRAYMLMIGFDPYSAASMASFDGEARGDQSLTMISGWSAQTALIDATMTPEGLQGMVRGGYAVDAYYAAHWGAVTDVFRSNGTWFVRIYNPWGHDGWLGEGLRPVRDGVNDGFLTMTWANFMANFGKYSWA
ncbi:MAG TPA: C2 family cysteine protease [Gemmataceae bacterium]|nr:C2 family cysteine protease [Gemmataceae bacterium]